MTKQFTLGKNERLKSRKLIEQLFSEGKSFTVNPLKVFYLFSELPTPNCAVTTRFGVGVSTKTFKRAVDRNRIKRLLREAWRLQKLPFQQKLQEKQKLLDVFFIYIGKELPVYKDVYGSAGKALGKFEKIMSEIK